MNQQRKILHLDLDSFFVSVERILNPDLLGKPVIIGGNSERGVVSSCSYEARKFGVKSAMPIIKAKKLCPNGIYLGGNMREYSKYSKIVTDIIAEKSPLFEKASIDEHYIDLTGTERFFDSFEWSKQLRKTIINETGLPISFGLSINKTIAKIATDESKPNGELYIPYDKIKEFLNPLSVKKIPMIGKQTYIVLSSIGIKTIEDLSKTPIEVLCKVFGKQGLVLWKKANGIDYRPVIQYHESKSLSSETTFNKDISNYVQLENVMISIIDKLAHQLRKSNNLTSCITIKIRYKNFETHTIQNHISYTSLDHFLIEKSKELFDKIYKKGEAVRLIGVKFSDFVEGKPQIDLFDDTSEMIKLYQSMDKIRNKYGKKSIFRAVGLNKYDILKDKNYDNKDLNDFI